MKDNKMKLESQVCSLELAKQLKIDLINKLIKWLRVDTNKISDGYNTFEELYEHRCLLLINLCEERRGVA